MNATIETFLAILRAALKGQRPVIYREIPVDEWHALFRMAGIHNVLPLFFDAVYTLPDLAKQQALLSAVKQKVRQQVVAQTLRTREFLELNDRLQAVGLRPLVVKGLVCRDLYPQPDHRPSSDEDVLISADGFDLAHRVLMGFGMTTQLQGDSYEIPYRKDGSSLYVELHRSLFPPESDAYGDVGRFFEQVADRCVAVQIQGRRVYTLNPTDHLLFLICHAFKHFLHSGFGIRQVCDIALYANAYGKQADWIQILENCRAICAEKFAAALFRIGQNYLGFDPDLAAYPAVWREIPVDEVPMLEDLLVGGLYGDASMSRKHSSNITLDAVAAKKRGRKTKNALVASIFPASDKLVGRYPYLKNRPYLLPVAWCSRLWTYGRETRNTRDSKAAEALRIGLERVELMKYYGILEK